ncbi:histidine kinase dimerization/phosphoacceptor domain -containing protein [Crocinitomix catalasitica]|uniref:histidine kinase dimerization/phosphoacceptor domain -containing protein n=1 Tax=Crocinitomix catalasitica TaxID=184607 RepID=UPI0004816912|nr:histidine kinase dimerization/phosphoacceptor domain -containing protein [Crocinitomix catalasitica]
MYLFKVSQISLSSVLLKIQFPCVVFVVLLFSLNTSAQFDVHEHIRLLNDGKNDSIKTEAGFQLASYYSVRDLDSLFYYIEAYKPLLKQDSKEYVSVLKGLSIYYRRKEKFELFETYIDSAIQMALKIDDLEAYIDVSNSKIRRRLVIEDYKSAVELIVENLEISKQLLAGEHSDQLLLDYTKLMEYKARIESKSGQYKKALHTHKEVFDIVIKLGDSIRICESKLNIAKGYYKLENYDAALPLFIACRKYINDNKIEIYFGIPESMLLQIYIKQNKLDKAKEVYEDLKLIDKNVDGYRAYTNGYMDLMLGNYDIAVGNYNLAIKRCHAGLDKMNLDNYAANQEEACECLKTAYIGIKDYEKALFYVKELIKISEASVIFDSQLILNIQEVRSNTSDEQHKTMLANSLLKQKQAFTLEKQNILIKDRSQLTIFLNIFIFLLLGLISVVFLLNQKAQKQKKLISKKMNDKQVLLKEIHHRVKNNFQVIQSLLNLHANQLNDPLLSEPLLEARNRIRSMAMVHENLYGTTSLGEIEMAGYFSSLIDSICEGFDRKKIKSKVQTNDLIVTIDEAVPLGLILNELITNSVKYSANEDGDIFFEIKFEHINEDVYSLYYHDIGPGIPEEIDLENLNSLGLELVQILIKQLNGEVIITNESGFTLRTEFLIKRKN